MRSKRSFFNFTVLFKDITRFFPVWGLFSVFLGLILLALHTSDIRYLEDTLQEIFVIAPGWLAAYAMLCGVTLFGDLFQSRLCNALHAMPMRREGWFFTHTAAGVLFFLVPFVLFCLLTVSMGASWGLLGIAILLGLLEYLTFFGMALLCIMLSGNRIGAVLLYGLLNFLAPMLQWIATTLYQPMLYGVPLHADLFTHLSPVIQLSQPAQALFERFLEMDGVTFAHWGYALLCGGLGLIFAAVALLLYRRRALETAGDFISVRFLQPVFLVAFSLLVATTLFELIGHDGSQMAFLILYLAVGFFFGTMLVQRRVRVFQLKTFFWYGVLVAAIFGTLGICRLDPLGITRQIPQQEQVERIDINLDAFSSGSDYASSYFYNGSPITDPEHIAALMQFHQDRVENQPSVYTSNAKVYFTYHLTDGTVLRRYYPISIPEEARTLLPVLSSWDAVFDGISPEEFSQRLISVYAMGTYSGNGIYFGEGESPYGNEDVMIHSSDLEKLLIKNLQADCNRGTMAQHWKLYEEDYSTEGSLEIQLAGEKGRPNTYLYLTVSPSCDTFFFINQCYSQGILQENRTLTDENVDFSLFVN